MIEMETGATNMATDTTSWLPNPLNNTCTAGALV
jgi:hypothetical protein